MKDESYAEFFLSELKEIDKESKDKKKILVNSSYSFQFGKYKNQRPLAVKLKDPFYIDWLFNKSGFVFEYAQGYKEKINSPITLEFFFSMPMGKFKGKTLKQILLEDLDYFEWLASDLFSDTNCYVGDKLFEMYKAQYKLKTGLDIEDD
jgi:uncharacterized protein (DUF3820 family)